MVIYSFSVSVLIWTEVYLKFAVHDRIDIYESLSICATVCNNKSRICTIWSCRIDLSGPLCPPWSIGRAFVFVVTRFIIKTKKKERKIRRKQRWGTEKWKISRKTRNGNRKTGAASFPTGTINYASAYPSGRGKFISVACRGFRMVNAEHENSTPMKDIDYVCAIKSRFNDLLVCHKRFPLSILTFSGFYANNRILLGIPFCFLANPSRSKTQCHDLDVAIRPKSRYIV